MIVNVSNSQVELAAEDVIAEVNVISGEIAHALVNKYEIINTKFQLNPMLVQLHPLLQPRSRESCKI